MALVVSCVTLVTSDAGDSPSSAAVAGGFEGESGESSQCRMLILRGRPSLTTIYAAHNCAPATGKRIFQMLEVVPDLGCDEACKYIKERVQRAYEVRVRARLHARDVWLHRTAAVATRTHERALHSRWQVGMLLFDSCGAQGDEACVKDSEAMCACEKKAGRVMCSELEYAWSELCPNTKSFAMHKGVCEGQLITQTRDMCSKTELLPGVLVSHSPLGSGGLQRIDDNWVGLSLPTPVEAAEPAAVEEVNSSA
jgi:hypothetical protein